MGARCAGRLLAADVRAGTRSRWGGSARRHAGTPRRGRSVGHPRGAGGTRVHRLLLPHRAGRSFRQPRIRLLCTRPAQMRSVMAGRPDSALHHRPGPLRRRAGARAGRHRRRVRRTGVRAFGRRADRLPVAGPAAQSRPDRAQTHHRPGAQQPVAGSAGPAAPAHRPHGRGASPRCRGCARCPSSVRPLPTAATARRCTATTRANSTTTSSGSRSADFPSRSAGSTRSDADTPNCTADSTWGCRT